MATCTSKTPERRLLDDVIDKGIHFLLAPARFIDLQCVETA